MTETLLFLLGVVLGTALGYAIHAEKVRKYKPLLAEIVETLCTICLYLGHGDIGRRNRYSEYMLGHFDTLKGFSKVLREEMRSEEGEA